MFWLELTALCVYGMLLRSKGTRQTQYIWLAVLENTIFGKQIGL